MYGRVLKTKLAQSESVSAYIFVQATNSEGEIDDTGIAEVADAASCCTPHLPNFARKGDIWLCEICDRVWAVPVNGQNWAVTKLRPVPEQLRLSWSNKAYRFWIKGVVAFFAAIVLSVVSLFLFSSLIPSNAVHFSFAVMVLIWGVSGFFFYKWSKLLNKYRFSVSDS